MGAGSSVQESPRKYGLAGEVGMILCCTLYKPPRPPTLPTITPTPTTTTTTTATSSVSAAAASSISGVIAVGKETIDLFSTITSDRRLRRVAQPSGSVFTCAEARADSILGPIIALGSDTGEISIVDAASLSDLKVIKVCASTVGAVSKLTATGREIVTVASALSASSSYSTPKPRSNTLTGGGHSPSTSPASLFLRITAINIVTKAVILVGLSDGSARSYSLANCDLVKSFGPPPLPPISASSTPPPPPLSSSTSATNAVVENANAVKKPAAYSPSLSREVVALAVYNTSPALLAIGRSDGSIDKYDLDSGKYLVSFKTAPGLHCLIPMLRLNCLACVHSLQNTMTIWDAAADRVIQLDFSAELQSIGRRLSKMTFARFDEHRSVLLCGDDAGSIFTRKVSRISETSDLAVKLVRVAAPAPTASAPTQVTAMWYDSRGDIGFTGDASGLVRVVSSASGVSIKEIAADLVNVKKDLTTLNQTFESLLLKKVKADIVSTTTPVNVKPVNTRPLALTVSTAGGKGASSAVEIQEVKAETSLSVKDATTVEEIKTEKEATTVEEVKTEKDAAATSVESPAAVMEETTESVEEKTESVEGSDVSVTNDEDSTNNEISTT